MTDFENVTFLRSSEAVKALIADGFVFNPPRPTKPLPGCTTITYPWCSKSGYLSARIVRGKPRRYRIEVVA